MIKNRTYIRFGILIAAFAVYFYKSFSIVEIPPSEIHTFSEKEVNSLKVDALSNSDRSYDAAEKLFYYYLYVESNRKEANRWLDFCLLNEESKRKNEQRGEVVFLFFNSNSCLGSK